MQDPAFVNFTMQANTLFYANMYVGSHLQRMKMLLDTCSSVTNSYFDKAYSGCWLR